jgi:hypothetical protein
METVRPWGERSSIVKIVPPAEWVADVQLLDKHKMSELEIRSPIEQRLKGNNGVFMQLNVERNRNRPLSIHEWFVKCNSHPDLRTPNPKEGDRSLNRDSKEARAERDRRIADTKAARLAARLKREAAAKRRQERLRAEAEKEEETANGALDESTSDIDAAYVEDLPALDADSATHTSPEPVMTTPPSEPAEPTIDPFYEEDWKKAWLPEGITQDDFDVAGCTRIENKFWKSLGTGKKDSWYGADLAGTLFADEEYPWNVAHLPNLLNKLPRRIPGVNSPYLYFGMWRAAFSWHVEDVS